MDVLNVASTGVYTILALIVIFYEMHVKMNVIAKSVVISSAVLLDLNYAKNI